MLKELRTMEKTLLKMRESLEDDCYIGFVSANDEFDFGLRKSDDFEFLDDKTLLINRKNGRKTIVNLDLIVGICVRAELI